MDVSKYREQVAAELADAAERRVSFHDLVTASKSAERGGEAMPADTAPAPDDDVDEALEVLDDRDEDPALRVAAIRVIGLGVRDRPELIDRLIVLLRDASEPAELRTAALHVLQQSTFLAPIFAPRRAEYLDALRSIIEDRDVELRRRAIGILAREKDEFVQRRLIEGLEDPSKAVVPAAKAIQYLGYDIHAEHFDMLRRIAEHPPSRAARKEAIRLLAADPSAKDLLADILADKGESAEIRKLSAVALQSLDPSRLEPLARRIALDDAEDDEVRTTSINALAHFASPAADAEDDALAGQAEQLRQRSASRQLRRASKDYLSKRRR